MLLYRVDHIWKDKPDETVQGEILFRREKDAEYIVQMMKDNIPQLKDCWHVPVEEESNVLSVEANRGDIFYVDEIIVTEEEAEEKEPEE